MTDQHEHEAPAGDAPDPLEAIRTAWEDIAPVVAAGVDAMRSVLEAAVTAIAPSLAKLREDLERAAQAQRDAGRAAFRHRGRR